MKKIYLFFLLLIGFNGASAQADIKDTVVEKKKVEKKPKKKWKFGVYTDLSFGALPIPDDAFQTDSYACAGVGVFYKNFRLGLDLLRTGDTGAYMSVKGGGRGVQLGFTMKWLLLGYAYGELRDAEQYMDTSTIWEFQKDQKSPYHKIHLGFRYAKGYLYSGFTFVSAKGIAFKAHDPEGIFAPVEPIDDPTDLSVFTFNFGFTFPGS